MFGVSVANRRNIPRVTRGRQPVAHDGGNRAPALTASAVMRAGFTGDQQNDLELLRYRLFQRTIEPVKTALKDAGVKVTDIQDVILVGGQTRMPMVQKKVADF